MRNCSILRTSLALTCFLITSTVSSQLQKIYLLPKAAGSEKQSRFIDSIRFIPLQVKDGINLSTNNHTIVTKNHFLIVDYSSKTIVLYSQKGDFIKKISFKSLGQAYYPNYDDQLDQVLFFGNNKNYTLTAKDEIKITLDWDNPRNKKYFKKYKIDLSNPSLIIEKDIPNQRDIIKAHHYYDDYYWQGQIITSPLFKDSLDYELKIYKENQLVKGFFPYNRINEPGFLYTEEYIDLTKTDTPNVCFVTRPFCDTIYKMIGDSLFPAYQLVLPLENSLPSSFFTKPFKNETERESFRRNNGWMFQQPHNFHATGQLLFFSIQYLSNSESYVYLKDSKATYKIKNIKPDSSHYNLQLLGEYGTVRRGKKFYKPQKAGDLISFFEQNKNVPVPAELETFLKSKPPEDAPIIVEFTFKNNQ
jgi:hypothetical protein